MVSNLLNFSFQPFLCNTFPKKTNVNFACRISYILNSSKFYPVKLLHHMVDETQIMTYIYFPHAIVLATVNSSHGPNNYSSEIDYRK